MSEDKLPLFQSMQPDDDYLNPTKRAWTIAGVVALTAVIVVGITLAIFFPASTYNNSSILVICLQNVH